MTVEEASPTSPASAAGTVTQTGPAPFQMMTRRDNHNAVTLGTELNYKVKHSRVLLVGAGGIGCELLKTLVLSGFGEIHIVDLDTIDLSNLNRQFLFRHEHIKKSKAYVARDAAQRFNPRVKLVAYHADIKTFHVPFYRTFDLVFNALDNLDARRHVNRLCIAADRILIESGTTGFNGQVQVIKRGDSACYDCSPKEVPKSFPVCTIRSTPSQPIHCIVWGKSYLLNEMFGDSEDESAFDHSDDAQNAAEIAELKKESQALKAIRSAIGSDAFAGMLFDKVFNADIVRLRSMEDMWKTRQPPEPLSYDSMMERAQALRHADADEERERMRQLLHDGQKVWTLEENFEVLVHAIERLTKRVLDARALGQGTEAAIIEFDKDDIDTLDFVVSSANIRASLFGIERKSRFDIKQMAGNIIPAIATTNAVVASLCVLEAFKVLKGGIETAPEIFLTPFANDRLFSSDKCRKPNPECAVCNPFYVTLSVDFDKITVKDLVEEFARTHLGFGEDSEIALSSEGNLLYDVEETDSLDKKLRDLGIDQAAWVKFTDESEDADRVDVHAWLQGATAPAELEALSGRPFVVVSSATKSDGTADIPKRPVKAVAPTAALASNAASKQPVTVEDDDDLIIPEIQPTAIKRPHEGGGDEPATKKVKVTQTPQTSVAADASTAIPLEQTGHGSIVLDD